jgi:hypothetical protein
MVKLPKTYGWILAIVVVLGILFFLSSSDDGLPLLRIEKDPPPEIRYELWIDTKACYEEETKRVQEALKGRQYPNVGVCNYWIDRWSGLLLKKGDTFYVPGIVDMQHIPGTEEEKELLNIQGEYSWAAIVYSDVLLNHPDDIEKINQSREEYKKAKEKMDDIFYW